MGLMSAGVGLEALLNKIASAFPDNFSYEVIPATATVTLPLNQQMIVHGLLDIQGTLNMLGTLVII